MSSPMANAIGFAIPCAIIFSMASALFGVAIARLVWADEATFARRLHDIRQGEPVAWLLRDKATNDIHGYTLYIRDLPPGENEYFQPVYTKP